MKYSVKITSSGRHILWCDRNWFETTGEPVYIYTEEEAKAVVKQLKKHYIFNATIISETGLETKVMDVPTPVKKEVTEHPLKALFHSKLSNLKKI